MFWGYASKCQLIKTNHFHLPSGTLHWMQMLLNRVKFPITNQIFTQVVYSKKIMKVGDFGQTSDFPAADILS